MNVLSTAQGHIRSVGEYQQCREKSDGFLKANTHFNERQKSVVTHVILSLVHFTPRLGTVDAKMKAPSLERRELSNVPNFYAWSRSEYSLVCFACYRKWSFFLTLYSFNSSPFQIFMEGGGGYWKHFVRPSVCPSVALSVCPIVSAQYLLNRSTIFLNQIWYGGVLS